MDLFHPVFDDRTAKTEHSALTATYAADDRATSAPPCLPGPLRAAWKPCAEPILEHGDVLQLNTSIGVEIGGDTDILVNRLTADSEAVRP